MEELGWIKVHRSIRDSKIWASPEGLKIWLWILLKAHHDEKPLYCEIRTGEGKTTVKVFQGCFIFGRKKAAEELGMSESMVYRWIKKLASAEYDSMICEQAQTHYTILQVNNWKQYQTAAVNRHWTSTGQPPNTYKNVNNVNNVKNELETLDYSAKELVQTNISNEQARLTPLVPLSGNLSYSEPIENTSIEKTIDPGLVTFDYSIDDINLNESALDFSSYDIPLKKQEPQVEIADIKTKGRGRQILDLP
jgi:hypothetical protein